MSGDWGGSAVVFRTSLEQMFKCTATKLDIQPMTTQQSTSQLFLIPLAACLELFVSKDELRTSQVCVL